MDAISIARGGLMAASARLEASANRTAAMGATDPTTGEAADDVDLGHEAVEQIEAKQQFGANLGVIRVADSMWKSLLEVQEDRTD